MFKTMLRKMRPIWAACGFGLVLMSAAVAHAQEPAYACVLPNGENVPILTDTSLQNVAVARRNAQGQPTIVINPNVLALFQPATRWFWLAHECAHQQLGHTLGHYGPDREQQADCYAAHQLVKNHHLDANDLRAIEEDISKLGGDKKAYLPGPQRAYAIDECVVKAVQEIQQSQ